MTSPIDIVRAAMRAAVQNIEAAKANADAAAGAVELAQSLLDAMEPAKPEPGSPCRHERKEDISSLGGENRWRCLDCGHMQMANTTTEE